MSWAPGAFQSPTTTNAAVHTLVVVPLKITKINNSDCADYFWKCVLATLDDNWVSTKSEISSFLRTFQNVWNGPCVALGSTNWSLPFLHSGASAADELLCVNSRICVLQLCKRQLVVPRQWRCGLRLRRIVNDWRIESGFSSTTRIGDAGGVQKMYLPKCPNVFVKCQNVF